MKYRIDVNNFVKDGELINIDKFPLEIASTSGLIYEVIRVSNNKALFLKEHLHRLSKSLSIKKIPKSDLEAVKVMVFMLIEANSIDVGNIKIAISFDTNVGLTHYLYFIPHRYPTDYQLKNGVKALLQYDMRQTPQAKIADWRIRGKANRIIDTKGVYETLLVNSRNKITEGSRSNVFFIVKGDLITAADRNVLSGITREKVLEIARNLNVKIIYKSIAVADLHIVSAAFLTGTSPGVLQINAIDNYRFAINNSVYKAIYEAYKLELQK